MAETTTAVAPTPLAAVQLPQWMAAAVNVHKDETVIAVAENKTNMLVKALLVSLPGLLALAAPFAGNFGIVLALLAVAGVFGVAFAMMNQDAKRALVLTTQRAVCLVGKNRYEAKP
jgi:hypothetical protein